MSSFTKDLLKSRINAGIKGKIGVLVNADDTMNQAVREVLTEADLRSTRRMVTLEPGVFSDLYAYPAPSDLKAKKILSLRTQANPEETFFGYNLIPYEQFNARYGFYGRNNIGDTAFSNGVRINNREPFTISFDDLNGVRRLMIAKPQSGVAQTISSLDSVSDGITTWLPFGGAANLQADRGNFLNGVASIRYDIDGTPVLTAGIQSLTVPSFSISNFLNSNDVFRVAADFSDVEDLTSVTLRVGVDVANYYEMTTSLTSINIAFEEGWNILLFDIDSRTTVGTVDPDNLTFVALFQNKAVTKINQSNFRFDNLVIAQGEAMELRYYSKYGWRTQAGVWVENSVNDDDILNADSDEFNLFVDKGIYFAGQEVDELVASETAQNRYDKNLEKYVNLNPSESLIETSDYMAQYFI